MSPKLPRAVVILGMASFLTDVSSEMIYPLLPLFLTSVLGASAFGIGLIEGIAESSSAIFKMLSGRLADRIGRKRPLILTGYAISGTVRPLVGLAASTGGVLALRFLDRIGKGIRTSPRDALIAEATPEAQRGRAYGLHRAMDNAGSVMGPLVAAALLGFAGFSLREVFLAAAIPAALTMVVLWFGVPRDASKAERVANAARAASAPPAPVAQLGGAFRRYLAAVLLFTLGNSSDAFLLLRMADAGVPTAWTTALWSVHSVVKMAASYYGGRVSDRVGHRRMLVAGWFLYAACYLAFAELEGAMIVPLVFLVYGLHFGCTEPAERALVASLAPPSRRGSAFGWFHAVVGLGALPASLVFGLVWKELGYATAFRLGAGLALAAAVWLGVSARKA